MKKAFGDHVVLNGVNLDVYKGEILGIIGTSGSGKTTFLHTMIGFLAPDCGEVRILVEPSHRALGDPTYKNVHKNLNIVKSVYGFASQLPSFYDALSVEENLMYFASLYQMPKRNIRVNMDILLHLMDLTPTKRVLAKNLSGGMERRLDIACSLIHDPAVLILDEPTADLDPVLRSHIYDLIKKINTKNTTIILASHHLSDMEAVCDRIAILKEGSILAVGTPEEIKDRFAKYHKLHVRLASGNYDKLMESMERKKMHKVVEHIETHLKGILIYTNEPDALVKELVSFVESSHDKIEQLNVSRPSLDDIFIGIVEDGRAKRVAPLSPDEKQASHEKELEKRLKEQLEKNPSKTKDIVKDTSKLVGLKDGEVPEEKKELTKEEKKEKDKDEKDDEKEKPHDKKKEDKPLKKKESVHKRLAKKVVHHVKKGHQKIKEHVKKVTTSKKKKVEKKDKEEKDEKKENDNAREDNEKKEDRVSLESAIRRRHGEDVENEEYVEGGV